MDYSKVTLKFNTHEVSINTPEHGKYAVRVSDPRYTLQDLIDMVEKIKSDKWLSCEHRFRMDGVTTTIK